MPSIFSKLKSSITNTVMAQLPVAAGNTVAALNTKVAEGAAYVQGAFGGAGPFSKLGSQVADLENETARLMNKVASSQAANSLEALEEMSRLAAEDAWMSNLITAERAFALFGVEAQVGANTISSAVGNTSAVPVDDDNTHKVTLSGIGKDNRKVEVIFEVMPEITESRTVEYEAVAPPQSPGAFQKYKGTSSVQWTVNATLVSRRSSEAYQNLMYLNQLRAWTMPFFGENTSLAYPKRLGAPPPVLTLTGWRAKMVGPVPVVITSLNWNFPQDVDYIPAIPDDLAAENATPFPVVLKLQIQLVESYSTAEFNGFDLARLTIGDFGGAFTAYAPISEQKIQQPGTGQAPIPQEQGFIRPGGFQAQVRAVDNALANANTRTGAEPNRATNVEAGGGRGFVNPPNVSELKTAPQVLNIPENKEEGAITSGGGGDFGGGGSSGSF